MGQRLALGIHSGRHDQPIGANERSLRLIAKAMHAAGIEVSVELIAALSVVVALWPCPAEAEAETRPAPL